MSTYSNERNVQDAEVNEILAPALELAKEFKSQKVVVHMFSGQDANGKANANSNTYKVYDSESKEYKKSITVEVKSQK